MTKAAIKQNKEKNKGGRPPCSLSAEQIKELEDMASNMTIEQIANYFGISERAFYDIKNRDFAVFAAYKKGMAKGVKEVAGKLRALIDQGDTTATIFYLKTKGGWSDKQEHEITYKGIPPNFNLISNEKPSDRQKD